MKTTKEMIEVMQAFDEGKQIQLLCDDGIWRDTNKPCWGWDEINYRIKPEPKEPKYRPYENTDEMIADYKARLGVDNPPYTMPLIWVKQVSYSQDRGSLISSFDEDKVWINGVSCIMRELCMYYTYLDDSPCGKLVEE